MPHVLEQDECDLTKYPQIVSTLIKELGEGSEQRLDDHDNDEVTAGDLHGNALYFLHFLIKYRVIDLDKASYKKFVKIYQKPAAEITKEDFEVFDRLLSKAQVNNNKKVRLLGDILADRGKNDYFTLKLIELLDKGGADLSILLSNHDAEFILNVELNGGLKPPFKEKMMRRDFTKSIEGLVNSIAKGDLDQGYCESLYRQHFLPHVKAIDYCFESAGEGYKPKLFTHAPVDLNVMAKAAAELDVPFDSTTDERLKVSIDAVNKKIGEGYKPKLFTHAPVDLNVMAKAAAELDVPFDSTTDERLKMSIDAVNKKIKDILMSGQFHRVFEEMITVDSDTYQQVKAFWDWRQFKGEVTTDVINKEIQLLSGEHKKRFEALFPVIARRGHVGIDMATKQARALTRLLWNRDFSDLDLDQSQRYWFVHGHDSQIVQANIWTLDGYLGKGEHDMKGKMPVLATRYDLPKYYHFVQYQIQEVEGMRVLTLRLVDKRRRFYSSDMVDNIRVSVDKGLANKDIIARINAMFMHEGSARRLKTDKKAIRHELGLVMSWPRPEGVSCDEIYQRLWQVYETNKKPDSHEIARVFNFNTLSGRQAKMIMREGQKVLHVTETKQDDDGNLKIEEAFELPMPDDMTESSAIEKLTSLYEGERLKPTTSSMMAQFSPVFNQAKPKGMCVKGIVEMSTELLAQEELEPAPNRLP